VSSLLDLDNGEGGRALQILTQQSQEESRAMRKLNEKMVDLAWKNADEAVIVTFSVVLNLIHLPLTVVSKFFSTSFTGTGPSSEHFFITDDWRILLVVAIPLTALTIHIWWTWTEIKVRDSYPPFWT
jgi:hypothetical protein